jgi:hypothetical protein
MAVVHERCLRVNTTARGIAVPTAIDPGAPLFCRTTDK